MSLTNGQTPDDPTLIRYLIGRASDEETERLDELSIADDEFVLRLRAVEHDLVDAYVNGELTGETLVDFEAQYLRSPSGLAKVEFARALHRTAAIAPRTAPGATASVQVKSSSFPQWGLAAAALLALAVITYLAIDGMRLRLRMNAMLAQYAELDQRGRQLQEEVQKREAEGTAAAQEVERLREQLAEARDLSGAAGLPGAVITLFLSPMTRSASDVKAVTISEGTETIILRLQGIGADFQRYEAVLKEDGSDRVIWRSGRFLTPSARDRRVLSIRVPADRLEQHTYVVELSGVATSGLEPVDSYSFRVASRAR